MDSLPPEAETKTNEPGGDPGPKEPAENGPLQETVAPAPEVQIDPSSIHSNISYSTTFTDSLIQPVLHPPSRHTKATSGMKLIAPTSNERPKNLSTRYEDIDFGSLPEIAATELPLALDDSRRIYASGVPGIKVTHPGGWLEGGAGPYPALSSGVDGGNVKLEEQPMFVREFLAKHEITTPERLHKAIKTEREAQMEELRKRMKARDEALEKNEKVRAQMKELTAERDMERRVHEKAREIRGMSKKASGA